MADSKIDIIGKADLPLIVELYNQIFQPAHDQAFFERRLLGRHNTLLMVAVVEEQPVGFLVGYEFKPGVFFEWLHGVLPGYRRSGFASQLMDAAHAWARERNYETTRIECHNRHRPMLHLAIDRDYDILGTCWDPDRHDSIVIFQKELTE